MSILNDTEIIELCHSADMIVPFNDRSIRVEHGRKILSKGVSSYGYDVSLSEDVRIFTNQNAALIDPKRLDEATLTVGTVKTDEDGSKYVILPPNSYMLGCTVEYFKIPSDVMIICVGKSTMARAGCIVNTTPIEAGFEGNVVIELANAATLPMKIYLNEGISQFIFFRGKPCSVSYSARAAKYQFQTGITLPRM
jgi:dCTP deaminase